MQVQVLLPQPFSACRAPIEADDRLATETTSARKLIDHLDQAVLAKAFRGELVPQDPSDEPASVLLERIRTERAPASTIHGRRKDARQGSEPATNLKRSGRRKH